MKNIYINYGATAYHYMLHDFRRLRRPTFEEIDLISFLNSFTYYATDLGYSFIDENNQNVLNKDIAMKIIDDFAEYTKDKNNRTVCYFSEDGLEKMRKAYETMSDDYKNAIYKFEEMYARSSYNTKSIYKMIEDGYKKCAKPYQEKFDEEHLA